MLRNIFILLIISLTLGSCQKKSDQQIEPQNGITKFNPQTEIKIAAIFSLTGSDAANNLRGLNGTRLAVKEINQRGGILGKKIFLQLYDDESSAAGAKECAKKAVKDSVLAILGCTYSSFALAAAPIAQAAGTPMIVHIATEPSITEVGDYIFRSCFINPFQSRLLAKFVLEDLNKKRVAIIFEDDNPYSISLKNEFTTIFKQNGGKITGEVSFKKEDTDFSKPLSLISANQTDIIFIPAYTQKSGMIIKQADKMSIKRTFVAGDGWSDRIFHYADSTANGSYFIDHWDPAIENDVSKKFYLSYQKEYGNVRAPNSDAALAYDAVYLLAAAITKDSTFNKSQIKNSLQSIKITGTTGEISFDNKRNPAKQAVIKKVLKKTIIYYKSIKL